MAKLKILKVIDDEYLLKDIESAKHYKFTLSFYGLDKKPKQGDIIELHNNLLDTNYIEYSKTYRFGPLEEVYGRNIKSSKDKDCILLIMDDKKMFLKRFFG